MSSSGYSLQDLGLAYRKAKVDLYYSSHRQLESIADYEASLEQRLQFLKERLNSDDESWTQEDAFLGGWSLAPKSIDYAPNHSDIIFASPQDAWKHVCKSGKDDGNNKITAEFRLMAQVSIDFHVLSSLWLLKVGDKYDKLLPESSYGNRLRRKKNGEVNPLSLGSFKPYFRPYQTWRDQGLAAMRSALAADKRIVAVTADVKSFYHELTPDFMMDPQYNSVLEVNLTAEENKLHRLFITALQSWAAKTPLKRGLPVGLPASALVANMALIELDRFFEKQIVPLYYGRYVDDLLLVLENGAGFQSAANLRDWLTSRSDKLLERCDEDHNGAIRFKPSYLTDCRILFSNNKNKVFFLSGKPGERLLDSIERQIKERSSEWRTLPGFPLDAEKVGTDLVAAVQRDGEAADTLRKTGKLSMKRAGFAIKLRDFEAYERDLTPDSWIEHRRTFFSAFIEHVLVLPQFFDLERYLPRVIRLAVACEEFEYLRKILDALQQLTKTVEEYCETNIQSWRSETSPSSSALIARWRKNLFDSVTENIVAGFPTRLSKKGEKNWQDYLQDFPATDSLLPFQPLSLRDCKKRHRRLFSADLAHKPFRLCAMPKEMVLQRGLETKKNAAICQNAESFLQNDITSGIRVLTKWTKFKGMPFGFLFATRPFSPTELSIIADKPFSKSGLKEMQAVVLATRGFSLGNGMPCWDKNNRILQVPLEKSSARPLIAVTSWKTAHRSWTASVMRKPDPDISRYGRLNRLLNDIISRSKSSDYCMFPELSIPARWFMRVAKFLFRRHIALVAGVEYIHDRRRKVRNQVWVALPHDGLGFPSLAIYRQDKQQPALGEEREIERLDHLRLSPQKKWKVPPIIQHGDFRFALLVCSELTNISYRSTLRGEIDALFVVAWNRDTTTFNALVESASLDIHSYIIQCNIRQYGDSRIRAPYKDDWKRDILRVKGGIHDYFVTGRIDIQALRRFQSSHRSSDQPFKPVPDGFQINHGRKMLPLKNKDE